ncbi:GNAT family N-acetyltransferase [Alkalibaculum sp. M08DMB]|uniref:GNAT family N-acetyltransferase n=1 Tax=Alkalibaculum sporogenes TaxID=2655001 RepID=A0A6A7K6K7_9FIRM|nr:GNAT family N-acetyltransferase [Alkalibaculum sporogenes]MPW24847.1 GNAT family N-acetyltransferase [Alkalibaculum sporogenes]
MKIKHIVNKEDLKDAFYIRTKVFVEEQGVSPEKELDQFEDVSDHIVIYNQEQPVAAGRVRIDKDVAKIQRVCVLKEYRKSGLGKVVVESLENIVKAKGICKSKLGAQVHAIDFYQRLGYKQISDEFLEEGILHIEMIKKL